MLHFGKHYLPLGILLALAGCAGDDGPTAPQRSGEVKLTSAVVSVDGKVLNGGIYSHEQGYGQSTHFEAMLAWPDGRPMTGGRAFAEYRHGDGMMSMMNGRFPMYDDGTHGDHVAGDGVYCYDDGDGQYGFHHQGAHHGDYRYDFWGEHDAGGMSNHMQVMVRVGG